MDSSMATQYDPQRAATYYEKFYENGGWQYSFWKEFWWHRRHIVKRFKLRRGMRMLEIASGSGCHTNVFNRLGLHCIGVDCSQTAVTHAHKRYPRWTFYCCDATEPLPVGLASFDVVFSRGYSPYHYDLTGEPAQSATRTLVRYLKPGGIFIMVIVTDLSGRRPPDAIWHNRLEDYREHFATFGERWAVDHVDGMAICALYHQPAEDGVIAAKEVPDSRLIPSSRTICTDAGGITGGEAVGAVAPLAGADALPPTRANL